MTALMAVKSFFLETGTYNSPVLRTYHTHFDEQAKNSFLAATEEGRNISSTSMSGVASTILKPQGQIDAYVKVANGFDTSRMCFVMEITRAVGSNGIFWNDSSVLTGYTDHADLSLISTAFDPNMQLFFNSTSIIRNIQERTPYGLRNRRVLSDSSHLLNSTLLRNLEVNPSAILNPSDPYYNTLYMVKPGDVVTEMQMLSGATNFLNGVNAKSIRDTRPMITPTTMVRSSRSNAVPSNYLSKIVNSVVNSYESLDVGYVSDEASVYERAYSHVKDQDMWNDGITMEIMQATGYGHNGFVRWGELCKLIPNLDQTTNFTRRGDVIGQPMTPDVVAGNFESWSAATMETVIANSLSQLIPAVMVTCLLGTVTFMYTNENLGTFEDNISISMAQPLIEGIDTIQLTNKFKHRFAMEIAPMLTDLNRRMVRLHVEANMSSDTFITISLNGGPMTPYCAPTFCDALYTPVVAPERQTLTNIANDLLLVTNSVAF